MTQLIVNGLIGGSACAIMALGFALIYNTTRIFHLAHGAVYTFGAYSFYAFGHQLGIPVAGAVFISAVLTGAIGLLIDSTIYRPLSKQNSPLLTQLLSSIGVYAVLVNLIAVLFGSDAKALSVTIKTTYTFGPIILTRIQLVTFVVFITLFFGLILILNRTQLGRVVRSMRDDPELLTVMGINMLRIRGIVFFVGSLFAGIAAILIGLDVGIDPYSGIDLFLTSAVALIIGGVGNFRGAALGALGLGVLQSLVIAQTSTHWQEPVTFLVLVFFLLLRPQGLLARRSRLEVAGR